MTIQLWNLYSETIYMYVLYNTCRLLQKDALQNFSSEDSLTQ